MAGGQAGSASEAREQGAAPQHFGHDTTPVAA
jgi:hypothetical protein